MFVMPLNPQHRQWRIRIKGEIHKLPISPKNEAELKQAISRFGKWEQCDIWYTISTFINPESISKKKPEDVITSSLFAIDIDDEEDLERARKEALYCYNIMDMLGFRPTTLQFSGSKGFHLLYSLPNKRLPRMVISERDTYLRERNERWLEKLYLRASDGTVVTPTHIDKLVAINTYGIIRLAGSLNQHSGLFCTPLTINQLKMSIETIKRLAMPSSSETSGTESVKKADEAYSAPLNTLACVHTSLRTKPFYLTNRVKGTKDRFIPIFKYPLGYDLGKALCRMKGLGTIYRFESDKWMYFISIMPQQARKVQKLVKKARCSNISHICFYPTNMKYCGKYYDECKIKSKSHSKLMSILTDDKPQGDVGVNKIDVAVMKDGK
jgi:hypothetical protein